MQRANRRLLIWPAGGLQRRESAPGFQGSSSWAGGPPINYEKFEGAVLRARHWGNGAQSAPDEKLFGTEIAVLAGDYGLGVNQGRMSIRRTC